MAQGPQNDEGSQRQAASEDSDAPLHGDEASPLEELSDLGRVLHLLSEVVSQLEDCELGISREVEALLREGLQTASALLDRCVLDVAYQRKGDYEHLARRMVDLLRQAPRIRPGGRSRARPPSRPSGTRAPELTDDGLIEDDELVLRRVEEGNGRYRLEIETVGDDEHGAEAEPIHFSPDEIQKALLVFEGAEAETGNKTEVEPAREALSDHEKGQLRELFLDIASHYAAPLSRILGELETGRASRQTVEGAMGIFRAIRSSAEKMGFADTADTASNLVDLFSAAEMTGAPPTGPELKAIRSFYDRLRSLHPRTFPAAAWEPKTGGGTQDRIDLDCICLLEELKAIPGLGNKRIERLFEAGLSSLDAMRRATPADLQLVAHAGPTLARRIHASFKKFQRLPPPGEDGSFGPEVRRRLTLYLEILRRSQYHYRKASLEESYQGAGPQQRRESASLRRRASARILALLAWLGRTGDVASFQKAGYDRRVALLTKLLEV